MQISHYKKKSNVWYELQTNAIIKLKIEGGENSVVEQMWSLIHEKKLWRTRKGVSIRISKFYTVLTNRRAHDAAFPLYCKRRLASPYDDEVSLCVILSEIIPNGSSPIPSYKSICSHAHNSDFCLFCDQGLNASKMCTWLEITGFLRSWNVHKVLVSGVWIWRLWL